MAWSTPITSLLRAAIEAVFKSYRPNADYTPYSDLWVYSRTLAHFTRGLHEHINAVLARVFPNTSTDEWLDRWLYFIGATDGSGSFGLIKARGSSGTDALQVTCTGGTPTITGLELLDSGGKRYQIDEVYTFPGAGTYNADVAAIDTGLATNLETGATLDFVSPPAGIQTTATLVADLDDGADAETNSEGQARLISLMQYPSLSGNWPQWETWIENAITGTLDAYVWPKRENQDYGWGRVDYTALQRDEHGTDREMTLAQKTIVETAIEDNAPVLSMRNSRCLDIDTPQVRVEIEYDLIAGITADRQCDWDAQANKRYVITQTPGSFLIEVNAVYGAGVISAGDRVFFDNDGEGLEATVVLEPGNAAAPVSGSFAKFTVSTWPWTNDLTTTGTDLGGVADPATGGAAVMSGGGLISAVYTAVKVWADEIGPAKGTYAAPMPGWEDTFRIQFLERAAINGGVVDSVAYIQEITLAELDGGVVDVAPSYGSGSSVELLIPYEIEIWEVK